MASGVVKPKPPQESSSSLLSTGVNLRDGRVVVLRAIRAADADLLIEFHDRLSAKTQYLRFFGPKPRLTRTEASYLATVDFESRFAIIASTLEGGDERILGVGRFDITEPGSAETAIVVRDDYQRNGLGTAILERLIDVARQHGVRWLAGEVLAENEEMIGLLHANGVETSGPRGGILRVASRSDGRTLGATTLPGGNSLCDSHGMGRRP